MRQRANPSKFILIGILILLAGIVPGGCKRKSKARDTEPRRVVATIYPLADIARRIGGKRVEVRWFIEIGQSLTDAPSGAIDRLRVADLVVTRGLVEPWALLDSDDPMRQADYIRLDLLPAAEGKTGYLWLDPAIARELAGAIRQRLTEQDPEYEQYFRENEHTFVRELDALRAEFQKRLTERPQRGAMFSSSDFLSFAGAFGVELVDASLERGETSDLELKQLGKRASEQQITTLFIPADRTPPYQRDLAARTGLKVLTLDPLGSSAPAGRSTYLQIMRYNLEQLVDGNP